MASPFITLRAVGPLSERDEQFSVSELTISGQKVQIRTHNYGHNRSDIDKRYAQNQRRKLLGPSTLNLSTHAEWKTLVDFVAEVCKVPLPKLGEETAFYEPVQNVTWERESV
jgi:hypothetical protein